MDIQLETMLRVAAVMETARGKCGGSAYCSACSNAPGMRGCGCANRLYLFTPRSRVLTPVAGVYCD